ncbi:MAG: Na(+)/H(+) antiporter subunit C [Acidimicrobiales bacterium]
MSLVLAACAAILFSCGTYLLLQRILTRVILGIALLGHGTVLLLQVAGGRAGDPPLMGPDVAGDSVVDPLPHALALTAIVITFGVTAFLLALAYRSWALTHDDEVQDDVEDRLVARAIDFELARAAAAAASEAETITEFDEDELDDSARTDGPGEDPAPPPGSDRR